MVYNDDYFKKDCNMINDAYSSRNLVHRGGQLTDQQYADTKKILENKAYSYLYLLGTLATFIKDITEGWNKLDIIENYIKVSNHHTKENQVQTIETGSIYSKNPGSIFINVRGNNKMVPEGLRSKIASCNKNDQTKVTFEGDTIVDVEPIA